MPTVIKGQPTSQEVIARLKAEDRPVLLAFSCGKDSLGAWCALLDAGIEVIPAYLYTVPGIPFVEDEIRGFEEFFGTRIHQYPHASAYRLLGEFAYQPPERFPVFEQAGIPVVEYDGLWSTIKDDLGLTQDTWVADGVRAADSIVRRASFVRNGIMKEKSHKVSPIADMLKAELMDLLDRHGVRLPIDYEVFGRSFDGIDYRFTKPMRDRLPESYEYLKQWFPLMDADIARHEYYGL